MNKLLLTCLFLAGLFGLRAQTWDSPSYKGEVPVSGTTYYVYNIGLNGFLNRGAWWGTQACITSKPIQNGSALVNKWTMVNPSGSSWTFQYNNNGTNVVANYLFDTGAGTDVFTDGSSNNSFTITEVESTDHIFSIQSPLNATKYIGGESATESTNKGIANVVRPSRTTLDNYSKWKFVSQANYNLFQAKVLLDRYMTYAKNKGGIDLTNYITTYNSDVIADINTANTNLLAALGRSSITVPNYSLEGNYTSWSAAFSTNNNTNTKGWSKTGTYYGERWITSSSNLATTNFNQTISNLASGYYSLSVDAHAIKELGSNPLKSGVFLFADDKKTEISSGGEYIVDNILVTDGNINIGMSWEGTVAVNWTAYDNFKLYYYGSERIKNSTLTGLSSSVGTIYPTFTSSNTAYELVVPSGTTTLDLSTIKFNNAETVSGDGTISNISLPQMVNIVVTSEDGLSNTTYSVYVMEDCFTKLYPSKTNMVSDPNFRSLSSFGGWEWAAGARNLNTDPAKSYCGRFSGSVAAVSSGTASIDYAINSNIKANTTYRVHAKIYSTTDVFNLGVYNMNSTVYEKKTTTTGSWEDVNLVFTTGASPTTNNCGVYFNNYNTNGRNGYIDNLEMYEVNNDVTLSGLTTSLGTLDPVFNSGTTSYNVIVTPGTNTVTLTGTATSNTSTISGDGVITLVNGEADATIVVTAESGTQRTYSVHIAALSNDASLSALTFSAGSLKPTFDANTTNYFVELPTSTSSVTPSVTKTNADATVSGDGVVTINSGIGTSTILVTAQNGTTTRTYKILYYIGNALQHSYTFDNGANDSPSNGTTAVNGTLVNNSGNASISGGRYTTTSTGTGNVNVTNVGDFISFSGADLNLQSYPAISLEYYVETTSGLNTNFTCLGYFGNGGNSNSLFTQLTRSSSGPSYTSYNDTYSVSGNRLDDGKKHHVVSVLTSSKVKMYVDGALAMETNNTAGTVNVATTYAYLGKSGWADPSWKGSIDEFNIYVGEMDAATALAHSNSYIKETLNDNGETTLSSDKISNELTVEAGTKLTLNEGVNLTVSHLNLNATGDQTATFVNKGSSKSIAGHVKLNLAKDRLWYISSPVTAATASVLNSNDNTVAYYDETQENGWTSILASASLTPGKGYVINSTTLDRTPDFSGTLNDGDITVNLSKTTGVTYSGYNLVGNPYPSFLNAASVITSNANLESSLWYRSNNGTSMVFDVVNLLDPTHPVVNSGRSKVSGVIPPMQAFWLKANTSTTLTFTNSMREHDGLNSTSFKVAASTANKYLNLMVSNGVNSDQCLIALNPLAIDAKDAYDTEKMSNNNATIPEIYTLAEGKKMVINALELKERTLELPLGFSTSQSNSFTIKATEMTNLGVDEKVYLVDNLQNTSTELLPNEEYSFNSDIVNSSDRFTIVFKSSSVLTNTERLNIRANVYADENGSIVIESNEEISTNASVKVFNLNGQMIYEQNIDTQKEILPALNSGIYLLRLKNQSTNTYKININ